MADPRHIGPLSTPEFADSVLYISSDGQIVGIEDAEAQVSISVEQVEYIVVEEDLVVRARKKNSEKVALQKSVERFREEAPVVAEDEPKQDVKKDPEEEKKEVAAFKTRKEEGSQEKVIVLETPPQEIIVTPNISQQSSTQFPLSSPEPFQVQEVFLAFFTPEVVAPLPADVQEGKMECEDSVKQIASQESSSGIILPREGKRMFGSEEVKDDRSKTLTVSFEKPSRKISQKGDERTPSAPLLVAEIFVSSASHLYSSGEAKQVFPGGQKGRRGKEDVKYPKGRASLPLSRGDMIGEVPVSVTVFVSPPLSFGSSLLIVLHTQGRREGRIQPTPHGERGQNDQQEHQSSGDPQENFEEEPTEAVENDVDNLSVG